MSALPFIFVLAVVSLLFFVVANLRASKNILSSRVLLRFYLYIASFVTLVVFASGASFLLTGLLSLASPDFSYERPVAPFPAAAPAGTPVNFDAAAFNRQNLERQRDQQSTDLIRGATLTVMGGMLFAMHAALRRRAAPNDENEGNFQRAFLAVGLVTFGLVGLVALPVGIYQSLKFFLIAPLATQSRVAPGETLSTGLVLAPLWIYCLFSLMRHASDEAEQLGVAPSG